jgi:hypothetical protein
MHRFLTAGVLLSVLGLGCQFYDFEPVTPFAVAQTTQSRSIALKALKPNLMLLVDQSLSMLTPINPSNPACTPGCGSSGVPCPAGCASRISDLKDAMSQFLMTSGDVARMGLTVFPVGPTCEPPTATKIPLPPPTSSDSDSAPLLKSAADARAEILAIVPAGGTPTNSSLKFLADGQGLDLSDERDDFVLLLTDGLPNCNKANVSNICQCDPNVCGSCAGGVICAAQTAACACTLVSCSSDYCALGCLDKIGVTDQVRALRVKGIRTIVVGFGADIGTGAGPAVLNSMAEAGGFARECPKGTDAECGTANRCINKLCETRFYQAANGAELSAALRSISDSLNPEPCDFKLDLVPPDVNLVAVIVNGQNVNRGDATWQFKNKQPGDDTSETIEFLGQYCQDIKNSSTSNKIKIEVRVVEKL